VAPFWQRWLVSALWCAVWIIPFGILLVPDFLANLGRTYGMASLVAFSVVASGLITLVQRPLQRSFAAAVAGTTRDQRSRIVKALRRGDVPADPQVLTAAIRIGDLRTAYRDRLPRWLRTQQRWSPVLYIAVGVLEFLVNDTWRRWFWVALTIGLAAQAAWAWQRMKRSTENLERLRAASGSTLVDTAGASLPPQRLWASLSVMVALGVGLAAMTFLAYQPRPGCRTADAVVAFIYANRDILTTDLAATDGDRLSGFQRWSDQLQDYSQRDSARDIAPRLRRIAELSTQVVALVRTARSIQPGGLSPDLITTYRDRVGQLIDEDNALACTCHPRR
jgi:hypothetical protein